MPPERIACALALFAVLCVLAIFLFPVMEGPYPAVHGPVTALLSIRAAARLRVAIRAGVEAVRGWSSRLNLGLPPFVQNTDLSPELLLGEFSSGAVSVLRC